MHAGSFPLLDDFRNQIKAVFDRWCDGLIGLAMISFSHDVCTQALAGFQWVGQRLYTGSVDGLHLINQPQNAVKGFGGAWNIGMIRGDINLLATLSYFTPILSALFASLILSSLLPPLRAGRVAGVC